MKRLSFIVYGVKEVVDSGFTFFRPPRTAEVGLPNYRTRPAIQLTF